MLLKLMVYELWSVLVILCVSGDSFLLCDNGSIVVLIGVRCGLSLSIVWVLVLFLVLGICFLMYVFMRKVIIVWVRLNDGLIMYGV